jgi:ATP-dependent RNA helicase SUPV3L1/SUV3
MAEWSASRAPLTALLGPTNTGKTHRAVERMLDHPTGMLGLPLRLLAREVYDWVSTRVGERQVALVTGEEKRIPPRPRYWVCTVEAMPVGHEVDFLAVDEVQLATHAERGHVFTDRLLHARGRQETWFMGAATVEGLLERLLPTARLEHHPRLSCLRYAGQSSLGKLPPRSAVVTFSAPQVYELGERLRRRKGGAAVVLGALSPRTRNAQVALYQSGEVDYLVATDAIGMGLNLQVNHVALGALRKFDGRETRPLETAEMAQIAGRAGRYQNDGTFGTLEPLGPLPAPVIWSLEQHRFLPERQLIWRNSDLDTSSLEALLDSLRRRPPRPDLRLVERAMDAEALVYLGRQPEIQAQTTRPERVALLWEVCQIPDFGHCLVEHHCQLLAEVYEQLTGSEGSLDPDWMARRIARLDQTEGDLDALLMRLESIRTFTYISHHSRWLRSAAEWQARTRQIEDRLSDALHSRLVERFVERTRVTHVPQRWRLPTSGERLRGLGALSAWRTSEPSPSAKARDWGSELAEATDPALLLEPGGTIIWQAERVARLMPGKDLLHPELRLLEPDPLARGTRLLVERRLIAWTRDLGEEVLGPLRQPAVTELSGAARGLVYQLEQGLGTIERALAREQIEALTAEDERALRRAGVYFGENVVYLGRSLRPRSLVIRRALVAAHLGQASSLPPSSPPSFEADASVAPSTYLAHGYKVVGPRAIRADLLGRIEVRLRQALRQKPRRMPRELAQWLGCKTHEVGKVVEALGYPARSWRRRPRKAAPGCKAAPGPAPASGRPTTTAR